MTQTKHMQRDTPVIFMGGITGVVTAVRQPRPKTPYRKVFIRDCCNGAEWYQEREFKPLTMDRNGMVAWKIKPPEER